MARCYKQALPILERDIIEIEPIVYFIFLLFFFYFYLFIFIYFH